MTGLAGRTVVVTRAADQAGETVAQLASLGATAVELPLIEIVDDAEGMKALAGLDWSAVDWIVVTSPNGARRATPHIGRGETPKIAAVGASTAAALPRCDLVATNQSAAGLLEVFPAGPGRVVVIQAAGAAPTLVSGLGELGWDVVVIRPYRTQATVPSSDQQRAALAADAVLFASGSAARAWAAVFGERSPPVVVAIGEQTAAAGVAAGLKISVIVADHSMGAMLVALGKYFSDDN